MKMLRITFFAAAALICSTQAYAVMYLARPYEPNMARWLTRDPVGERGFQVLQLASGMGEALAPEQGRDSEVLAGPNVYAFLGNDPLNDVDEFGLMSWQAIMDYKNDLEAAIHNTRCCCNKPGVSRVDEDIAGKSSGSTVTGTGTSKISGCVETYRYYWWDCYSASSEGGLSWSWKDFGWSAGGGYPVGADAPDTYSKTAVPGRITGPLGLRDPYHLAMESVVVFTFCGKDGFKHAAYTGPGYGLQWTWDKKTKSWTGPASYK